MVGFILTRSCVLATILDLFQTILVIVGRTACLRLQQFELLGEDRSLLGPWSHVYTSTGPLAVTPAAGLFHLGYSNNKNSIEIVLVLHVIDPTQLPAQLQLQGVF